MAECKISCKVKRAITKGSEEEAWALLDETMENIQHRYPDLYKQTIEGLEELAFKIPYEEAYSIVRGMRPRGEVFSYDETRRLLQKYGVQYKDDVEYYLVLNMMANDYQETARRFGLERNEEFYLCMAHDFIDDTDGKPFKVQRYFLD